MIQKSLPRWLPHGMNHWIMGWLAKTKHWWGGELRSWGWCISLRIQELKSLIPKKSLGRIGMFEFFPTPSTEFNLNVPRFKVLSRCWLYISCIVRIQSLFNDCSICSRFKTLRLYYISPAPHCSTQISTFEVNMFVWSLRSLQRNQLPTLCHRHLTAVGWDRLVVLHLEGSLTKMTNQFRLWNHFKYRKKQ